MNTSKYIVLLFFLQTNVFGQSSVESEIKEIFTYTFVKPKGYLYEYIDSSTINYLKKKYLSGKSFTGRMYLVPLKDGDTLTITDSERETLDSLLCVAGKYKWTTKDIKNYGLPNLSLTNKTTYDKRSQIKENVYEVMHPIFIRDNTICFTFYMIYCPGMCSLGGITIHRKTGNRWNGWIQIAEFQR